MASKIVVNLDTSKEVFLNSKCKQNDDLILECNIFENGLAKDLTNCSIVIQALKADKTYIIQNTDITKNKNNFIANLVRDFTRVSGETEIEIVLTESSKQNTTFSFCLEVVGSVIRGAVESKNTVTILENLQDKIEEAGVVKQETEQLIEKGGAATKGDIQEVNAQLETKEHKMKFINVPDNSDLAEYFKNVDTIGTHRVSPGTGVTNACNDASSAYSFYYVYQTFVLGITDGGRLFKASFINKTLDSWEEVMTNKKTSFKLTPKAGFTIAYQNCYAINNVVYINARFQMTDGSLFQPTSGNRELATIPTKYCPTEATALQSWAASASTIGLPGASSAVTVPDGRVLAVNTGTPKTITISGVYFI